MDWLLFPEETEDDILVNPYIYEGEVQAMLKDLFKGSESDGFGSSSTEDREKCYLYPPNQFGSKRQPSNFMIRNSQMEPVFFEPLFLVKWKQMSYAHLSWEPLSVLKGENLAKVKEFLAESHSCSMSERHINMKLVQN